jgi:hypothetical protein
LAIFGIKYVGRKHAEHLLNALKALYSVTWDWDGKNYTSLTLNWDYNARTVDISMPGYIEKALARFAHPSPDCAHHKIHSTT